MSTEPRFPPALELLHRASPSLEPVWRSAARAALSEAPILILGEPGTGRSTLARALHAASPRSEGPLIEVDAGAIAAALFESELFGHVPGAFTGAEEKTAGRVARAEAGSLMLDHVEEIPLATQPKLLRLLAESRYAPLGGREVDADVRFLAVAPEDLDTWVEKGRFRADLYYRLEVVTLRLPPLRERRSDLEATLEHFLGDFGERFDRPGLALTDRARGWMGEHTWPGNLRELRNVLERELVLNDSELLDPDPPVDSDKRPASLADCERREIVKALAYTRGHQGRAAELLGISRKALWEKRKRYGLP